MSTILNYTKGLIKEHHLAIIFFFIVGFISVAPQILSIRALGNDYQGIHFIYIDDEVTYMTAIRDILDGHWLSGSPFFYEYKYLKSVVLPWGNYFYALPTLITGFSLVNILIISKFLFPAGLFILIYLLIKKLIGDGGNNFLVKISAVSGGLFATLGYDLLDYKWAWSFLSGKIMDVHLLIWTRPVNPITGALLVFIFLLSTWSIINKRRPIYAILTTGLLLGLMTYYFFSWGIAAAILGSLIAVCLFRKKYREAVALTAIGIINFLVSLPFWFNVLKNI
ncbi:MAG: hypothetical protein HW405_747, partial [Candidatus Berkelbacteria bacterium]|nr:hypothetical protein [Candidatus Berkelbacteria bacterium]